MGGWDMMTSTREQHRTTSTREQQRWKAGWGVGRWVGGWWVGGWVGGVLTTASTSMPCSSRQSKRLFRYAKRKPARLTLGTCLIVSGLPLARAMLEQGQGRASRHSCWSCLLQASSGPAAVSPTPTALYSGASRRQAASRCQQLRLLCFPELQSSE